MAARGANVLSLSFVPEHDMRGKSASTNSKAEVFCKLGLAQLERPFGFLKFFASFFRFFALGQQFANAFENIERRFAGSQICGPFRHAPRPLSVNEKTNMPALSSGGV